MTGHANAVPVTIVAYAGYRSKTRLRLRARVLRHERPRDPPRTAWQKFRAMARLYASREVAGVAVTLSFDRLTASAVSDGEGFVDFDCALPSARALPARTAWETGTMAATSHPQPDGASNAQILAPGGDISHAVISDLDDTVLETGVWNLARNWRRVLLATPADRVVVPGVEDLFRNVGGGAGGEKAGDQTHSAPSRPFFYVSSSPWNLYGFLTEFLKLNGLPHGPMSLKDWGLDAKTFGGASHGDHKTRQISSLIEFYPQLDFILIGDDSQGDVAAYAEAVTSHADRVSGVFIRNVHDKSLSPEERSAIAAMRAAGVPVWEGSAWDAGDKMIEAMKLTASGEVAQVSKTLEKTEVEHEAPLP